MACDLVLCYRNYLFFLFFFNKSEKIAYVLVFPLQILVSWMAQRLNFHETSTGHCISNFIPSVPKICWKVMPLNFFSLQATLNQSLYATLRHSCRCYMQPGEKFGFLYMFQRKTIFTEMPHSPLSARNFSIISIIGCSMKL